MLRLLACLAFFACARVEPVAHALGTSVVDAAGDSTGAGHALGASNVACVERTQVADALPASDLRATEPEPREVDAALGTLTFRLSTRSAPILRCTPPAPRSARATWRRPQPASSVALAQGPP